MVDGRSGSRCSPHSGWTVVRSHLITATVAAGGWYLPSSFGPLHDHDLETQEILTAKADPTVLAHRVLAAARLLPPTDVIAAVPSGPAVGDRLRGLRRHLAHLIG